MYSGELKEYLLNNGASEVGFANLSDQYFDNMQSGISIVLKIPKKIIKSIRNGPNIEYYNEYNLLNNRLDREKCIISY